jgi:hypothetical protein
MAAIATQVMQSLGRSLRIGLVNLEPDLVGSLLNFGNCPTLCDGLLSVAAGALGSLKCDIVRGWQFLKGHAA